MTSQTHLSGQSASPEPSLPPNTNSPRATRFSPPPIRGDQRVFFVGKTNSGKSYVARYLLKLARKAGWRIVIIDPKKDWQGRGDDARPYGGPDNKSAKKGTVDNPVPVTFFRSETPCSNLPAGVMGRRNGGYGSIYHGSWEYYRLYRRSDTTREWEPRPAAWLENYDYAGPISERWGMGWDSATDERTNSGQGPGGSLVYFPTHEEGRPGDSRGSHPNRGDAGAGRGAVTD